MPHLLPEPQQGPKDDAEPKLRIKFDPWLHAWLVAAPQRPSVLTFKVGFELAAEDDLVLDAVERVDVIMVELLTELDEDCGLCELVDDARVELAAGVELEMREELVTTALLARMLEAEEDEDERMELELEAGLTKVEDAPLELDLTEDEDALLELDLTEDEGAALLEEDEVLVEEATELDG